MNERAAPLLEVSDLKVHFSSRGGSVWRYRAALSGHRPTLGGGVEHRVVAGGRGPGSVPWVRGG